MEEREQGRVTAEAAFAEHAAVLYRYIYSKVGQATVAEDLTSRVFLKALRWLQADRSGESVRGWLYATARTTIADYWRSQGALILLPLDRAEEEVAAGPDAEEDVTARRSPSARRRRTNWAAPRWSRSTCCWDCCAKGKASPP